MKNTILQKLRLHKNLKINFTLNINIGVFSIIILLLIFIKNSNASSVADSIERVKGAEITLISEYNDNIYLKSNKDQDYLSDIVLHFAPKLNYQQSYKRQTIGVFLDGDLRKGINEVPYQTNGNASGFIDVNFSGMRFKIQDYYKQSDFDLGLYDYPIIDSRKLNNFTSNVYYTTKNNLTLNGNYANRWFTYSSPAGDFTKLATEFGGGINYHYSNKLSFDAQFLHFIDQYQLIQIGLLNRNANSFKSKLNFPVSAAINSYLSYQYEDQKSPEQWNKDFKEHQALLGLRWDREHKAVIWIDAGYGYIQYVDSTDHNYKGIIGNIGFDYGISNNLSSHGLLGIDLYNKLAADFELQYEQENQIKVSIFAKRKTKKHFLLFNYGDTYISTNFGGNITTYLSQYIKLKADARYTTRDEFSDEYNFLTEKTIYGIVDLNITTTLKLDNLDVNFKGGFLQYSNLYSQNLTGSNRLIYTKIWGNYIIANHYKPGAFLLYARRYSSEEVFTFENLRFGISFSYIF